VDEINALAAREKVPARIAKGELEGKMKCRIWRKLHAEEAKRFDQVYALMAQNPGLNLGDGFGVLQSGLTVAEFMARKERTQRKVAIKQARAEVANEAVAALLATLVESKAELSVVLGERTVLDMLVKEEPIAFTLERSGRIEKLQVVLVARRADWEGMLTGLQRDPKLAQKPANVARQPDKRPHSDPRPFLAHVGQPVRLVLRNGITLELPLMKVGSFDLLLGEEGHELFVPLHAILRFESTAPANEADAAEDEA
jgi:sRNA-binding regulator protein Hfq